jgi:hypothetical protein
MDLGPATPRPVATALANTVPGQVAAVFLLYQLEAPTICSLFLP